MNIKIIAARPTNRCVFKHHPLIGLDLCEQSGSNDPIAVQNVYLSYDVTSGSKITPCNKIDKPLAVCRSAGYVMKSRL